MEHFLDVLHRIVFHFGFPGFFVVVALGNMGIPAGTEIVIPTFAAVAAQGHFGSVGFVPEWIVVGSIAVLAEVAGGSVLYAIGYYGGYPFVHRYGKYIMFRDSELARVHGFYERYGNLTVLICRFIPFIRGISAFPAGLSRMRKRLFVGYTALGSAVYFFILASFVSSFVKHVGSIIPVIQKFAYALMALVIIAIIAGFVAWRQRRRNRARSVA